MAKEVLIYTTQYCPYCFAAKKLLKAKGVRFREIDVTNDDSMREKLIQMTGGRETVPQIFADGRSIGGYQELAALYESGKTL
ncbi:MAG: glutaredoxin 3 [Candidatus Omnitrophica bacterium]|nr:glutaredoxin 3 [Candidatus Omnitrophota bacterium]